MRLRTCDDEAGSSNPRMPAVSFAGVSKYFYQHSGRMLLRDRLLHSLRRSSKERAEGLK
jgi:hypothetical protein